MSTISLYREFIRNSKKFTNYNFREYFLRRSRQEFRKNMALVDKEEISAALTKAKAELEILKRQSTISQLYTFDKLVLEPLHK